MTVNKLSAPDSQRGKRRSRHSHLNHLSIQRQSRMATSDTDSGIKPASGKEKLAKLPQLDWELNWEHALGFVEDTPRPAAWSKTNTIFFAHPSLPRVCGRHIHPHTSIASKTFELPVPPQLLSSPPSYGSPNVISLAPSDAWLFAYFPPSFLSDSDGLGCIYQSALVPGAWSIAYMWHVQRGNGIVSSQWLGFPREWTTTSGRSRPHRNVPIGVHSFRPPTLLLVTQSHRIELICRPNGQSNPSPFTHLKAPLYTPWGATVDGPGLPQNSSSSHGGSRVCVKAAIGFAADNQSIVVATWSKLLPTWNLPALAVGGPDFQMPSQTLPWSPSNSSWENWGDEGKICLTEVVIDCNSGRPAKPNEPTMETMPMPAITIDPTQSNPHDEVSDSLAFRLTHLEFVTAPLPRAHSVSVEVKKELIDDTMEDEQTPRKVLDPDSPVLQLVASFMDFKDYKSAPASTLQVWKLEHEENGSDESSASDPNPSAPTIVHQLLASRTLDASIVSILQRQALGDGQQLILGTINVNGTVAPGRGEGIMGALRVIRMDLDDDEGYDAVDLHGRRQTMNQNLPASIVLSPSRALAALTWKGNHSAEMAIVRAPSLKVHAGVRRNSTELQRPSANQEQEQFPDQTVPPAAQHQQHTLAGPIALAILRNCDITDSIRAFWSQSDASMESATRLLRDVVDILGMATSPPKVNEGAGLDSKEKVLPSRGLSPLDPRTIGLALGLFRAAPDAALAARWSVASHLVLLRSAKDAFTELKSIFSANDFSVSPETPPLTKLIGFTKRYVELCELLIKEAVIWEAWRACGADRIDYGLEQQQSDTGPEPSGILICLLHPDVLNLLVDVFGCIKDMQGQLAQVNHITKKSVSAIISDARVDFSVFIVALNEISKIVQADHSKYAGHLREAMLSLSLPLGLRPLVNSCTELINKRPGLSQKLSLLVPSLNFPDFDLEPESDKALTTTNKFASVLPLKGVEPGMPPLKICNRCGERSDTQLHDLMSPTVYGAYVRKWRRQCYCGGFWVMDRPS